MILVSSAFLLASCTPADNKLKPPAVHVYRGPQVWVTRAPTVPFATELAEIEVTATIQPDTPPLQAGPTWDEQQYLLDDIDSLFNDIENRLDSTNVNP